MHFSTLLATVSVALLRSSWSSCFMRAALFIMRATNSCLVFTFSLYTSLFIHPHRQKSDLYAPTPNSCIFTPTENWTHVYMNLFTLNSPYCDLLKYLLFLLKHPVYIWCSKDHNYMFRLSFLSHLQVETEIFQYIYYSFWNTLYINVIQKIMTTTFFGSPFLSHLQVETKIFQYTVDTAFK